MRQTIGRAAGLGLALLASTLTGFCWAAAPITRLELSPSGKQKPVNAQAAAQAEQSAAFRITGARAASLALPPSVAVSPVTAESFIDPGHWNAEYTPDPRYAEVLTEAAGVLYPKDKPIPASEGELTLLEGMRQNDSRTYSHMMRAGLMSGFLALLTGHSHADALTIATGARLHDMGKNKDILKLINQPRRLTPEERKLTEKHPEIGAEIVSAVSGLDPATRQKAVSIALNHHEYTDGSGYPRGVPGRLLPIEGKVTMVADVFDAMNEMRPYKDALSVDQAIRFMDNDRNRPKFDGDVLKAFKRLLGIDSSTP